MITNHGTFTINQVKNESFMKVWNIESDYLGYSVDIIQINNQYPKIYCEGFELNLIDSLFISNLILFARNWALNNIPYDKE